MPSLRDYVALDQWPFRRECESAVASSKEACMVAPKSICSSFACSTTARRVKTERTRRKIKHNRKVVSRNWGPWETTQPLSIPPFASARLRKIQQMRQRGSHFPHISGQGATPQGL